MNTFVINAFSVNDALMKGVRYLDNEGVITPSRNGMVKVAPGPVVIENSMPRNRVLSIPGRGDNPFFHLVEALWMLAGRNSLADLTPFVKTMANFSDDGGRTQPGAYGHRWREHFAFDQLDWAVGRLRRDPNDRRVVVSMWDGTKDPAAADAGSRDVPCNTQLYLLVRDARLEMTVTCRSNDAVWGAHGANAVHFSVLQEYLASRLGLGVGTMYQVSNNYHLYMPGSQGGAVSSEFIDFCHDSFVEDVCHYYQTKVRPYPLFDEGVPIDAWDEDLAMWWEDPLKVGLRHSFFRRVATPMLMAHKAQRKSLKTRYTDAAEILKQCFAEDWQSAGLTWLNNKAKSKAAA